MKIYPDIWTLPYGKSPMTFFVGQQEAPLYAGEYVFDGVARDFLVKIPLIPQSVYFFLDFDFSVDVPESEYTGALVQVPLITITHSARPNDAIFRQPFPVPVYFRNKWLLQGFQNTITPNELQFRITGSVKQTASLVGVDALKATIQFTAYEVTDPDWSHRFREGLSIPDPKPATQPGTTPGPMAELARSRAANPQIRLEGGLNLPAG